MNMIEKVARQIFSANTGTEYYGVYHPAFEHEQEHWEILATAAIEAMLEPSASMISVGDTECEDKGMDLGRAELIYAVMIEAAIQGDPACG